ncbi:MAG: hypothetical protein GY804_11445 [Alphaproteobacteria bacterium]|nr:hypothetical protein [Alphaproteobacteria bacterium]
MLPMTNKPFQKANRGANKSASRRSVQQESQSETVKKYGKPYYSVHDDGEYYAWKGKIYGFVNGQYRGFFCLEKHAKTYGYSPLDT